MILILIGAIMVAIGVYVKYLSIKFKNNGIKVKARVTLCERINKYNGKPAKGYNTTFEFQINGENITETMFTSKKFTEGSIKNAVYLKGKKKNILSVLGEGFYLSKGGEIVLILFGMVFIMAGLATGGFVSTKVLLITIGCFIGFIFIGILLSGPSKKRKKKRDEVRDLSNKGDPKIKDIISEEEEEKE